MCLPSRELEQDTVVCSERYMLAVQELRHVAEKKKWDDCYASYCLDTRTVFDFG